MSDLVRDDDTIIIQMHDGIKHMLKVTRNVQQKVARSRISVNAIIGAAYGDIYEVSNKRKLQKLEGGELIESLDMVPSEYAVASASEAGNNSHYVDSNTAQKLSMDEVVNLRVSGTSGLDIIKSLIANSETWSSKTEFAREKWLKRKQKKYISRLRIERCTPASLCDVYHAKSRDKILNMRSDTLAQILSQGSIVSGRKVLIFDGVLGLVVGAAAYRMRGSGRILAAFAGQQPHFELVDCLNLDEGSTSIIKSLASVDLGPAATHVREHGFNAYSDVIYDIDDSQNTIASAIVNEHATHDITKQNDESSCKMDQSNDSKVSDEEEFCNSNAQVRKPKRKYQACNRQEWYVNAVQEDLRQGVESLVIASKHDPLPILTQALHLLSCGCPFVVYHEFLEPLVLCYNYLNSNDLGIRLVLADTWKREFQVLAGRTHPSMYMSATGGFLLYGTYVGAVGIEKLIETEEK